MMPGGPEFWKCIIGQTTILLVLQSKAGVQVVNIIGPVKEKF